MFSQIRSEILRQELLFHINNSHNMVILYVSSPHQRHHMYKDQKSKSYCFCCITLCLGALAADVFMLIEYMITYMREANSCFTTKRFSWH